MCEKPPREWSAAVTPPRIIATGAALGVVFAGITISDRTVAAALIMLACVVLLFAVVIPTLTAIEFGFPSALKLFTSVPSRQNRIRRLLEHQHADLMVCAKLLCTDGKIASELLEAAMARAVSDWRGPPDPTIREYVLCRFVHRLMTYQEVSGLTLVARSTAPDDHSTLAQIVVVLADVGQVRVAALAEMVGLTTDQVHGLLAESRRSLLGMRGGRRV